MITSRHLCRAGARAVVVGLVLTVGACQKKGGAEQAPDPAGRVNAVQVSKSERVDPPEEFCDTYRGPDRAETLEWPALKRDPPAPADGWRWINVWAT
ncbi:MAG: hypothetical protein ABEL76_17410, partial [Bradymonadaceae bacterium]